MEPTHAIVPLPLMRGLAGYLGRRPYDEVAGLLDNLARCEPYTPPPAPEPEETPDES